jgi:hypothetical protein
MQTFPTFDIRTIIRKTLDDLRITLADFASLQERHPLSIWSLQRVMRGDRQLDHEEEENLAQLCRELKELAAAFEVGLDWRDTFAIRNLMRRRREMAQEQQNRGLRIPPAPATPKRVSDSVLDEIAMSVHPEPA